MSIFCSQLFKVNPFQNFLFVYSVSNFWLNWRNFPAKKIQAPKIRMRRFFFFLNFSYNINKGYFQVVSLFQ